MPRAARVRVQLGQRALVRFMGAVLLGLILPLAAPAADDSEKKAFSLPADDAEPALKRFAEQSGREVIFPTNLVKGVRTHRVSGVLPIRAALEQMLAGTPLGANQDDETGAFAIVRLPEVAARPGAARPGAAQAEGPPPLAPRPPADRSLTPAIQAPYRLAPVPKNPDGVPVKLTPFEVSADQAKGYFTPNTTSGTRLTNNIGDIPSSVTVIDKQQMENTNAQNINDIMMYEAGTQGSHTYTPYTGFTESTRVDDALAGSNDNARASAAPTR